MDRPALRSYTGAFGFGGELVEALEDLAGAVVRRASHAPPTPIPPPPESSSGVRPSVRAIEQDDDPEPVTLDLSRSAG